MSNFRITIFYVEKNFPLLFICYGSFPYILLFAIPTAIIILMIHPYLSIPDHLETVFIPLINQNGIKKTIIRNIVRTINPHKRL